MNKRQLKLTDYEGFTEKFKPKKTTDDCHTPQWIVLNKNTKSCI